MGKFVSLMKLFRYYGSFIDPDLLKLYTGIPARRVQESSKHLDAAISWLCRAQDAIPTDNGVSRSYSLTYHPYFQKRGWVASYPETTGYIIPTMFDYALLTGKKEYHERAVRMADWECSVQLDNGAVQGGTVDQKPTPAVFNTGQVIFGWLRAYQETRQEKYLHAASRAGDFLVDIQAEDGSWRSNLSDYAGDSKMEFYAYNTRTAWALLALSELNDPAGLFRQGGSGNISFTLQQQRENGWFASNCLSNPAQPLLHTIAYCIRGVLESGMILDEPKYIERARLAADALLAAQRQDGSLAGRYDEKWRPAVEWSCLTGNAQTAIIWGKLYQKTGEKKYLECMEKINGYMKKVQLLNVAKPDIYGGICGSYPLHGEYGRHEILNWAVKFFADSLMFESLLRNEREGAAYAGPQS